MIGSVNGYKIIELKNKLGIETQLSIGYTTFESGSKRVIEKGWINQDASGDLEKKIVSMMTGSAGITILRLIYTTWPDKNPTIRTIRYEHKH